MNGRPWPNPTGAVDGPDGAEAGRSGSPAEGVVGNAVRVSDLLDELDIWLRTNWDPDLKIGRAHV